MLHYYSDIIRSVRIRLNRPAERPALPQGFQSIGLPLDELIASVIEQSAVETVADIPPAEYPEPKCIPDSGSWVSDHDMIVRLPDDFGRLVVFRLSAWERFVDRLTMPGDAEYPLMFSPLRMLRGSQTRPRCYLIPGDSGNELLASSVDRRDEVIVQALYIPVPKMTGNAAERKIEFPRVMLDQVVAKAAEHTRVLLCGSL